MRENRRMANKSCTVRMCCKCYSPVLTLKGNICGLEMTIGRLMIGTSLQRNGAAGHGECSQSTNK